MAKVKLVQQLTDRLQEAENRGRSTKLRQRTVTGVDAEGEPDRQIGREYPWARIPTLVTTRQYLTGGEDLDAAANELQLESDRERDSSDNRKIVDLWANPSAANWTVPTREALQKVKSGSVRYGWRNRARSRKKNTAFGEYTVGWTFQSGSVFSHERGTLGGGVPPGLDDFYDFLALLNEPRLLADGRPNYHVVVHTSAIFPRITCMGWFTPDGLTFAEEAQSGYGIQWTCSMEVHQTYPRLWNAAGLRRAFGDPGL